MFKLSYCVKQLDNDCTIKTTYFSTIGSFILINFWHRKISLINKEKYNVNVATLISNITKFKR